MKLISSACLLLLIAAFAHAQSLPGRQPPVTTPPTVTPPPTVTIPPAPSQTPTAAPSRPSGSDVTFAPAIRRAGAQIKAARPAIPDHVLEVDQLVIRSSFPEIVERFRQREWDEQEAREAALAGWAIVRVGRDAIPPDKQFSPKDFTALVDALGKLVIRSTPTPAEVWIDGEKQDNTELIKWVVPRTYRIRITSEPDFQPVEEDQEVKEGKRTVFERTLARK